MWKFTVEDKSASVEKIDKVQEKRTKARTILTMEEAWTKIGGMKNSDSDKAKLREVYKAFQDGKIGREIGSEGKSFSKAEALRLYGQLQESLRTEKLEELVKDTPDNYILIQDIDALGKMYVTLAEEPIISVDTETTGLNLYGRDTIVGVSLTAPKADLHYYIPLRHQGEKNAPFQTAINVIKRILDWKSKEYILANAIFDMHQFANEGISISGKIHDVQEIMRVLNENEMTYRLKDLVTKYLKLPSDTFETLFGKNCRFDTVPLKYARYYACKDTHVTWLLYQFQMTHLKQQPFLYNYYMTVEQPLIKTVFKMEREGFIPVLDEADKVSSELSVEVEQLRLFLLDHLGDINMDSPAQLLPALQNLGLKIESTAKPELKKHKANKVVSTLLEYREKHKLNKDFISRLRDFIQDDGKIHGTFKQNGARTGRFSSVEPNLQQIPPSARRIYRVDDNSLILGLDFSAQEPRMLAHYTQEPVLIKNYSEGRDLYASLASEFYGKPYEECYKTAEGGDTKERKTFKVVVLAIMYGMGAKSLSDSLGITVKEGQAILDKFNESFPNVANFVENNTKEACNQGYVEMVIEYLGVELRRKRRLPFFKGENPSRVYDTYSTNAKIQGTSAIQTKLCMIEGAKLCDKLSTGSRSFALLASVHDELLFRVPKDITREEVALFEEIMTGTVKLNNIPSGTDGELGNVWGEMTPVKFFYAK